MPLSPPSIGHHNLTVKEHGYVSAIGLSNVNAEMLLRAISIGGTPEQGGIVSVQNEFSPRYRLWADVIDICTQYGIAYLPWAPLGGAGSFSKIATGEMGVFNTIAELNRSCPPDGPLEGELLDLPKFRA